MNITIPASFWTRLFVAVQGVVILTHWAYISCYTDHTICKETLQCIVVATCNACFCACIKCCKCTRFFCLLMVFEWQQYFEPCVFAQSWLTGNTACLDVTA